MSLLVLPAASRAITVSTFAPDCSAIPLTDQAAVPVAVPLPPRLFDQVTWVTPTLSAAVPPRFNGVVLVLKVVPLVGAVIVTVGGVVSGAYVTVSVSVFVLPAASRAVTVSTFAPDCSAIPFTDQAAVPVAVPLPPRLFDQVTCVTPTLSAAVPPRFNGVVLVLKVVPLVGAVIVTVGGVVSGPTLVVNTTSTQ